MGRFGGVVLEGAQRAQKREAKIHLSKKIKPPLVWGGLEGLYWKEPNGHKKREAKSLLFFCAQDRTRTCKPLSTRT